MQFQLSASGSRVMLNWGSQFTCLCLTNLLTGAYTLVGTAGWFQHLFATIKLTRCSGLAQAPIQILF